MVKMSNMEPKYIFITGGVLSGLGKGITAASLGRLLINRGLKVTILKLDAYINVDTSMMSPLQHGEVFVTEDGAETDLDIGHYERFLGRSFTKNSNYTMGRIYQSVIAKERAGAYAGRNVQIIPEVTNEIISIMQSASLGEDIVIIEVGGTIGDIESMVYIEAIRQFRKKLGVANSLSIHVTLVPYMASNGELKTKPTQASVRELGQMGVSADIVVCRMDKNARLDTETREKIAMFCNLDSKECVIQNHDCRSIYEVPLVLKEQKLDDIVLQKLGLQAPEDDMREWRSMVKEMLLPRSDIYTVAIAGKYTAQPDSYISVSEAIKHAAAVCGVGVTIKYVEPEKLAAGIHAVVVTENDVLAAAEFAKENKIPFLQTAKYGKRRPEFISKPYAPHTVFVQLIQAVKEKK